LAEATRRRVFRTAGVYLVAVWGLSQGMVELAPLFGAPDWLIRAFVIGALAFLPVVVLLAWMFDIGRGGIVRDPRDVASRDEVHADITGIADMPTILGGDASQGAVIVRWTDVEGSNGAIFAEDFVLGRGSESRVRFYDPLVSRDHARVYCEDGIWQISDLGSRNGTTLNGKKIDHAALVEENDVQLNEAGPILELEVVAPGDATRAAMTRFRSGRSVAHIRSAALDFDRTRGSGAGKK
jgi:pSer/pThr/pTyr-binding forkhead associated (FHA) protein